MEVFLRLAGHVPRPARVLDVGGTPSFWRGRIPDGFSLTLLNLVAELPLEGLRVITGDGCDLSRFQNNAFDIVFSNSVLGHVGDWERQQQMAREIRRVGRRYFLQTPNQRFPLDWRTLVPCFHWLPPSVQAWCFQRMPVGRYSRVHDADLALHLAARIRNITRLELEKLFPEGTIVSERICGLTKSFMVHHGFE
jgi:SAM-dependent methyltransferase